MSECCPVCQHARLYRVVSLRDVPVFCNILLHTPEDARRVARGDLDLVFCTTCGHTFNRAFEPEKVAYSPQYENSLHFSPRFQAYAETLTTYLVDKYDLYGKTIVEVGAGQGDFLELICRKGGNRGIGFDPSFDPSRRLPPYIQILPEYYGADHVQIEADLVCCRHVLEHIPNPRTFLRQIHQATARRHVPVFFEVPNMAFTYREGAVWDLIYEHYSYFSPSSLECLFQESGFEVRTVRETFGGQYLTIEAVPGEPRKPFAHASEELVAYVRTFERRFQRFQEAWKQRLVNLAVQGKTVVVWGAGSKGVTFVNLVGSPTTLKGLIDRNPRKQGKYISGSGLPIYSPAELPRLCPDVIIVMNPNYIAEIREQVTAYGLTPDYLLAIGSVTEVSTVPGQKISR